MKITTIGIDLAKNVFQVHAVDAQGKTVLKKQLKRDEMSLFFNNLAPCLIGMEACGTLAAACYEVFFTRTLFGDYMFIDFVETGPAIDGFTPVDPKLLLGRTATLTLAPVLGFWLLSLTSVATYRWVRAGFKR